MNIASKRSLLFWTKKNDRVLGAAKSLGFHFIEMAKRGDDTKVPNHNGKWLRRSVFSLPEQCHRLFAATIGNKMKAAESSYGHDVTIFENRYRLCNRIVTAK